MGGRFGGVLFVLLASLLHHVEEKHPALPGITPIRPRVQSGVDGPSEIVYGRIRWGFLASHRDRSPSKLRTSSERALAALTQSPHFLVKYASSASLHESGAKDRT